MDTHKLFAYSTVATAPSPPTSGTSLVVAASEGANFPQPSTDGAFYVMVCPAGVIPSFANAELLRVTARSTDTFTIVRNQASTSSRTIAVGDQVFQPALPLDFEALSEVSNALTSDVVMTNAAQFYDGPTVTPAAGRWMLAGSINLLASTAASRAWTAKLWDGTTAYAFAGHTVPGSAAAAVIQMPFGPVFVTANGSTAYKISASSTVTLDHIQGAAPYDLASYIRGVRIG